MSSRDWIRLMPHGGACHMPGDSRPGKGASSHRARTFTSYRDEALAAREEIQLLPEGAPCRPAIGFASYRGEARVTREPIHLLAGEPHPMARGHPPPAAMRPLRRAKRSTSSTDQSLLPAHRNSPHPAVRRMSSRHEIHLLRGEVDTVRDGVDERTREPHAIPGPITV